MLRFSYALMRTKRAPGIAVDVPAPSPSGGSRRAPARIATVAVLDDDEDVAVSIAKSLERAGFGARSYTTAQALLDDVPTNPFDCLIADWSLRLGTAQEVITTLRSIETYRDTPVIVLSGNLCLNGRPASADLRSAIAELDLIFRSKPRTTADLLRDIREICAPEASMGA